MFEKGFVTDHALTIRQLEGKRIDVFHHASVYLEMDCDVLGLYAATRDVTANGPRSRRIVTRKHDVLSAEQVRVARRRRASTNFRQSPKPVRSRAFSFAEVPVCD